MAQHHRQGQPASGPHLFLAALTVRGESHNKRIALHHSGNSFLILFFLLEGNVRVPLSKQFIVYKKYYNHRVKSQLE